MTTVFAGVCSHGPGITGRAHLADPALRDPFHAAFYALGDEMRAARPDALVLIGAEHFGNFFMNNMPAFAVGMADEYHGPVEDPAWLGIAKTRIPGHADLSQRLITEAMQTVDLAYAEEWMFDHGLIVPLHFLTPKFDLPIVPVNINCQGPPLAPLHRAWALGQALRRAADAVPERIAIIATGGISHWPATPDSGKINVEFDHEFMRRWAGNDQAALLSYNDVDVYREAGQGGFEIRTYIALAAAAGGAGHIRHLLPIPIFSTMCTIGVMDIR